MTDSAPDRDLKRFPVIALALLALFLGAAGFIWGVASLLGPTLGGLIVTYQNLAEDHGLTPVVVSHMSTLIFWGIDETNYKGQVGA